jgi:hypothetical protein
MAKRDVWFCGLRWDCVASTKYASRGLQRLKFCFSNLFKQGLPVLPLFLVFVKTVA